jgi:hypothetical protein
VKPSDCPHRPGTPEFRQWQAELLAWQRNPALNPDYASELARVAADRDRMNAAYAPSARTREVDALMAEVAAATRPKPELGPARWYGSYVQVPRGALNLGIIRDPSLDAVNDFKVLAEQFTSLMRVQAKQFTIVMHSVAGAFATIAEVLEDAGWVVVTYPAAKPSRHASGRKRRRGPAAPAAPCRHGNPANFCRQCSTKGFRGH